MLRLLRRQFLRRKLEQIEAQRQAMIEERRKAVRGHRGRSAIDPFLKELTHRSLQIRRGW